MNGFREVSDHTSTQLIVVEHLLQDESNENTHHVAEINLELET